MEICRLEHIRKTYDTGETVEPLSDVSLSVNSGDFIAIEGPSGMGKSTLLFVMGTLLSYDGGTLSICGQDVAALGEKEKTNLRSKTIGYMFQDATLIQALSVYDNLLFAQTVGGRLPADPARIQELVERMGLPERRDFFPHQLSGGQRRRVMAARALIHNPKLVLVDEPTNDLNEEWSQEVVAMLNDAAHAGAGVVMVTHNNDHSQSASKRYRLERGVLEAMA